MVDKEILQIKTKELFDLLSVKDIDFLSAHRLLSQVYNVIWLRYKLQHVNSPESTALTRWDLEDARDKLNSTLYAMNLCYLDAVLVRWIADHCEYETDGK